MRRKEFADSCRHLGVTHCQVLDYPDGALDRADFHDVTGDWCPLPSAPCARTSSSPSEPMALSPPIPTTAWPDCSPPQPSSGPHAALATRPSWKQGLTPWQARKLYYVTTEFSLPERPVVSLAPVTARISVTPYINRKNEAFAKHKTQHPLQPIFEHAQRQAGVYELFHLVATAEVTAMAMEHDLFQGLREL